MARSRNQARIIAVAGPKGGIGRSTCTTVLARALAARERSVLVVDTGIYGNLATMLDLPMQTTGEIDITSTAKQRIDYVKYGQTEPADAFYAKLRGLSYDDVILDLQTDLDDTNLDRFVRADIPIVMAAPEPATIDMVTRWIRRAFIRYMQQFGETSDLVQLLEPQADTWTFSSIMQQLPTVMQARWMTELAAFRCAFLLNFRREHSESLQSRALCHALGILLGVDIRYLGSLEFDDRRWFFIRQLADVSSFMREDPLVREMDTIVRDPLATLDFEPRPCLAVTDAATQPRQFLRADTPEQAREQYRLLWEGYRRERGLVASILDKETVAQTITQLEIAYRRSEDSPASPAPSPSQAVQPVKAVPNPTVQQESPANAGQWIAYVRLGAGLSVSQLALKARLPSKTIERIELLQTKDIPNARLQAYLLEIARVLEIPQDEILTRFGLNA